MSRRLRILLLSAQNPVPPRSGFEMRVYQLARQASLEHDVTVLTLNTRGERNGYIASEAFSVEAIEVDGMSVRRKRVSQAIALATGKSFTATPGFLPKMQAAVDRLCSQEAFDVIQVESSVLGAVQFPIGPKIVLDEHNIESEVFTRVGEGDRSPLRRTFNHFEASRFGRFEQAVWRRVDGVAVTSSREVGVVRAVVPETPIEVVPNGVDLEYFRPSQAPVDPQSVVFTGVLDYRPNIDGLTYFVEEVWPLIRAKHPQARFTVIGRNRGVDLRWLTRPGIEFLGEVPDIRPFMASAAAVVVPIRMGGGTRLKVVEALSMGKAVVSTSLGCEGISVQDDSHLLVADSPKKFSLAVSRLLSDRSDATRLGTEGRLLVEREYSWALSGERLAALYSSVLATQTVEKVQQVCTAEQRVNALLSGEPGLLPLPPAAGHHE